MKSMAFAGVLSIFVTSFAAENLVGIINLPQGTKTEYRVIRQISNLSLAIIDDRQRAHLEKSPLAFSVLDSAKTPATRYCLISNKALLDGALSTYGVVLKKFEQFFLFKTEARFLEPIKALCVRFELLAALPVNGDSQVSSHSPGPPSAPNPLIVKLLQQTSLDTMRFYVKTLQSFPTRVSSSTENKTTVVRWLEATLKPLCDSVYQESVGGSCGPNVIGIRKGKKNPSLTKYCVIGAHFDAVTQNGPYKAAGADDNASGVAGVLECARVFKKYSFENSVKFVLFNGEENGLLGSSSFTAAMKSKNHQIIGGAVIYDMLGHSTANSKNLIQLEGTDKDTANKNFITMYMQGIVDTYTKMKTFQFLQGFGSDHVPFWGKGYVGMLCIEREYEHPAYHKNFDTLDCPNGLNDMALFTNISKTGTAAIATLAVPIEESSLAANAVFDAVSSPVKITKLSGHERLIFAQSIINQPITISIHAIDGKRITMISNVNPHAGVKIDLPAQGIYFLKISHGMDRANVKLFN